VHAKAIETARKSLRCWLKAIETIVELTGLSARGNLDD